MNRSAPLVSIITPAFNAAAFLPETYESLRAQTVSDWEWIVSNDGSTDATLDILRGLARSDPRVRPLDLPARRNQAIKRNEALREARGGFIAFLDADDLWLPQKLELQLAAMNRVEKPGLCYTSTDTLHMPGTEGVVGWPEIPLPPAREAQYRLQLLTFNWASPSTMMLTREFFEEVGFLSEHPLMANHDFHDLVLRTLTRRPMLHVPARLVKYRIHPNSSCRASDPIKAWRRYLQPRILADHRGEVPPMLRRGMYARTWTMRALEELRDGTPTWRIAFLKALCMEPWNPRRWPNALALMLPADAMRFVQSGLRELIGRMRARWRRS